MRMKNAIAAVALSLAITQPVVATAATVSSTAQKLSLRGAVPADARVSAKPGKSKAVSAGLIILIVAGVAGVVAIAASGGDDSDSN